MLTEAQFLDQLLNPPKRVSNSSVATQRSSGGQFEGRAGTMARSNKGNTYRKANGRRVFIPDLATWHRLGLSKDTQ